MSHCSGPVPSLAPRVTHKFCSAAAVEVSFPFPFPVFLNKIESSKCNSVCLLLPFSLVRDSRSYVNLTELNHVTMPFVHQPFGI